MKKIPTLLIAFALIFIASIKEAPITNAADSTQFNPTNIIDDSVFTNSNSMSVPEIQQFLNSKMTTCDTYGQKQSELGGGTRAEWAQARGYSTTFTCLKDYYENPATGENNYGGKPIPSGAISSAQIIYNYSKQFNINPQVIITTLQKEKGMVTDEWPILKDMREAMGFGCPDNVAPGAPACDPSYGSFSTQIYQATRHFRGYMDRQYCDKNLGWCTPYIVGENYIAYNPNSACGGSNVKIENYATSALYSYTPYQPNQNALNAGYGVARLSDGTQDGCGAYGNRNFYLYFSDWFGSVRGDPFKWKYVYQAAYTDQNLGTKLPSPLKLLGGKKVYFTVSALNTGTQTWKNYGPNPIKLGTSNINDHNSILCDSTWENCSRPAKLTQSEVKPGEIGTFGYWANIPKNTGYYKEHFNLVAEGLTWLNDTGLYFDYEVIPTYTWEPVSADFFTDSTHTEPTTNGALVAGEKSFVTLRVKNTGNTTWNKDGTNPIRLATNSPRDRISTLCSATWIKCDRLSIFKEDSVAPGGFATFDFSIDNPNDSNYHGESLNIVIENKQWMIDANYTMWLKTNSPTYTWTSTNSFYTTATKETLADIKNLQPGQKIYVVASIKNVGNTVWRNSGDTPVKVGTFSPNDHTSRFYNQSWLDPVRPGLLKSAVVKPNEVGTMEFWLTAPSEQGTYTDHFNLLLENKVWMSFNNNLTFTLTVK